MSTSKTVNVNPPTPEKLEEARNIIDASIKYLITRSQTAYVHKTGSIETVVPANDLLQVLRKAQEALKSSDKPEEPKESAGE